MKNLHLQLVVMLLLFMSYAAKAQDMRWNQIRKSMEQYLGNELTGTNSVDVSIIFPDQGPVNLSMRKNGVSRDTSILFYRVASCSKPVTAAMTMMLIENGLFGIDDTVSHYFDFDSPYADQITFRMLLSHSSGLNSHSNNGDANWLASSDAYKVWNIEEKIDYANKVGVSKPGTEYLYSNTGIDLVGNAIGAITGIPTEKMIGDSIFAFLGIESFIDVWSNPKNKIDRLAENYRSYEYHQTFFKYSGANTTSTFDNAVIMKAIYAGYLFDMKYADMMMTSSVLNPDYGLASRFWWDYVGSDVIFQVGHTGTSKNYKTYAYYIPELDVALCVSTNKEPGNWSKIINKTFNLAVGFTPSKYDVDTVVVSPKLKSVIASGDSIHVYWEKYNRVILDGFRLYTSEDNQNWNLLAGEDTLNFSAREFKFKPESQNNQYVKLTAVNKGREGLSSDIYTAKTGETKLLIVDGFDRYGQTDGYEYPTHEFVCRYAEAIVANQGANYSLSSCSNEDIEQGLIDLIDYSLVFWILGDENSTCETFSNAEQEKLSAYLENGGKFFVSGSEIGWDLNTFGEDSDKDFYANYLKAKFKSNGGSGNQIPATGIVNDDFDGYSLNFGEVYDESLPDEIEPINGSEALLKYAEKGIACIGYHGTFGTSETPGAMVYLAFPLESGANNEAFNGFIAGVIDYLNHGFTYPVAYFTSKQEIINDEVNITFNAGQSYVNDGQIVSYEWDFGDGSTLSGSEVSHSFASAGDYTVNLLITDSNGKTDVFSETITIDPYVASIAQSFSEKDIRIYPNPANNQMYINVEALPLNTRINIFTFQGQMVEQYQLRNNEQIINLSHLRQGVYIIRFVSDNHVISLKAIKKR